MPIVDSNSNDKTAYVPNLSKDSNSKTNYDDMLFNTIKNILTISGGLVGAGGGTMLEPGGGSVAGALAGSGLGRGLGQSIQNLYGQQSNRPIDPLAPYKAIPEGAGMELGGQVGGSLLNKLYSSLAPETTQSLKDVLATDNGKLRTEFHGSNTKIDNPQKGFVQTGNKGNQVFFTTPNYDVANSMGMRRSFLDNGVEAFNAGKMPEVTMNQYGMAKANQFDLHTPVSMAKANQLGNILGLSKSDINESIKNSIMKGDIDADSLWNQYLGRTNPAGETNSVHDVGNDMIEKLKNAGYRRMSVNIDPMASPKETIHFEPESDLYNPSKLNALKERLSTPQKQESSQLSKALIDILSKSAVNQTR